MDKMEAFRLILGFTGTICIAGVIGWVATTWLRIKHGYPLEGHRGAAVYPRVAGETAETIAQLTQENAALRSELGAIRERLVTVERIVTDAPRRLASDIDALRVSAN